MNLRREGGGGGGGPSRSVRYHFVLLSSTPLSSLSFCADHALLSLVSVSPALNLLK